MSSYLSSVPSHSMSSNQILCIFVCTYFFFPLFLIVFVVIYSICEDFQLDFYAMYGCVGLWSSFFLVLYSLFDVSRLMRWSTRSTEEIFALFISIAFCVDAFRDTVKSKSFFLLYFSILHVFCPTSMLSLRFQFGIKPLAYIDDSFFVWIDIESIHTLLINQFELIAKKKGSQTCGTLAEVVVLLGS